MMGTFVADLARFRAGWTAGGMVSTPKADKAQFELARALEALIDAGVGDASRRPVR